MCSPPKRRRRAMSATLTAAAMAIVAAWSPLHAQAMCPLAGVTTLGTGTPGSVGVPALEVLGLPAVDSPAPGLLLSGGAPFAPAQFVLGLGIGPVPLPQFGALLWPGRPLIRFATTLGANGESPVHAFGPAALPPSTCGLTVVVQGLVIDGAAVGGAAFTAGHALQLGAGSSAASLMAWPSYPLGKDPRSAIGVGDLDGDGRADLVVPGGVAAAESELCVFRQLADRTLAPPLVTPTPDVGASGLAVFADRDDDGVIDLTTPAYDAATQTGLVTRKGLGDGTFGAAKHKVTFAPVSAMALGDLDADGLLDVVVAPWSLGTVAAIPGAPGLNLGTPQLAFVPGHIPSRGLALADVDLDGALDVLGLCDGEQLAVLPGDGSGGLGDVVLTPLSLSGTSRVAAGDVDGDGATDVVVGGLDGDAVTLLLLRGDGAGGLLPGVPTALPAEAPFGGPGFTQLLLADLDGDADDELLARSSSDGIVWTTGDGGDGALAPPAVVSGGFSFAVGDIDGDGVLDLALQIYSVPLRELTWLRGLGDGGFDLPTALPVIGYGPLTRVASLDGDAHLDLVAIDPVGGVAVTLGHGDLTFAPALPIDVGGPAFDVAAGDLDGDGATDLAVTHDGVIAPGYAFARGLGDGSFAPPVTLDLPGKPGRLKLLDADLDGRPDVLVAGALNDGALVRVLPSQPDGTPGAPVVTPAGAVPRLDWLVTGDIDGDGLHDLIGQSALGAVIAAGTGTAVFDAPQVVPDSAPASAAFSPICVGDADGDGDLDLFGQRGFEGLSLWINDGAGGLEHQPNDVYAFAFSEPSLVDVNLDGAADLVTDRGLWLGTGGGTFAPWQPCTVCGGDTGDLDGDGDPDFVLSGLVMPNGLR